MMAKSHLGLPRFGRSTSSCPHTRSTIAGVRASTPSIKREKHAKMHASACLSVGCHYINDYEEYLSDLMPTIILPLTKEWKR
jgi:hypothetical protein